jgi:uncharacterized protein YgbK (DUF1537 family)
MLAIIADDLTGTLDTAAPFASRGLHVEVALAVEAIAEALREKPDVIAVNLASRETSAEEARRASAAALAALPPGARLFKKVDSRLKGHIAAELDAMRYRCALVAPAIPDFGRLVQDGHVQGFGVDVPISIADRLGAHVPRAVVPETPTQDAMDAALDIPGIDLLIGARGLADALAARMSGGRVPCFAAIPQGHGLFVIGSRDPITLAQIDALRAAGNPRYLPAPNGVLADARPDESPLTLVQAVPSAVEASGHVVSQALAESVCPALTGGASTLLLSGGATAEAVLARMGIARFRLMGECLPGLGLAHAQGHCIIAKSGGFGGPETLKEIADRIVRKTG